PGDRDGLHAHVRDDVAAARDRSGLRAGDGRRDGAVGGDLDRVETACAAVRGAAERSARREDERVLVVRCAGEVLEAREGDASERTIVDGAGTGGARPLAVFAVGSGIVAGALDGFVAAAEGSFVTELVVGVPVEPEDGGDPDAAVDAEPVTLLPPCVATETS